MKRLIATLAGVVLMAGGLALTPLVANAGQDDDPWVCHPVEGNGETGYGWNLIRPDKASSHIDEVTGAGKHTRKDGRTDVYATANRTCPGAPTETPTTEPPEETPEDASYEVVLQDATCITPEGATITMVNANVTGFDKVTQEGPFEGSVHLYANEGHAFPDGLTEIDVPLALDDTLTGEQCDEGGDPGCPRVQATEEPCGETPPATTGNSMSSRCVGNALVTTVTKGNFTETSTVNGHPACRTTKKASKPGDPVAADNPNDPVAPTTVVKEEGM